jgi:hypothetical protein
MKQNRLFSCAVVLLGLAQGQAQTPIPAHAMGAKPEQAVAISGKVLETTNAATYTYVLVDTGKAKTWAAAPQFQVKVGDSVSIADGMPMPKYHSKTLNRDFDVVYFAGSVVVNGDVSGGAMKTPELPKGHPPIGGAAGMTAAKMDLSGIKKADGGLTVAEVWADKAKLGGQSVKVRGKVVKYNPGIMGKNWLHLRDGTGAAGSNDLLVTSATEAKVGDVVTAEGKVSVSKDFGAGYKYDVMVEDAKLTAE